MKNSISGVKDKDNSNLIRNSLVIFLGIFFIVLYFSIKKQESPTGSIVAEQEEVIASPAGVKLSDSILSALQETAGSYTYGFRQSLEKARFFKNDNNIISLEIDPSFKEIDCRGLALITRNRLADAGINSDFNVGFDPLGLFATHYFASLDNGQVIDLTPPYSDKKLAFLSENYKTVSSSRDINQEERLELDKKNPLKSSVEISDSIIPLSFRKQNGFYLLSMIGAEESHSGDQTGNIVYMLTVLPETPAIPIKYNRIELRYDMKKPGAAAKSQYEAVYDPERSLFITAVKDGALDTLDKYVEKDDINKFYAAYGKFKRAGLRKAL